MREMQRQAVHLFLGFCLVLTTIVLSEKLAVAAAFVLVSSSFVFLMVLRENKIIKGIISRLERKHEQEFKGTAVTVFFFGFFIFTVVSFVLELSLVERLFVLIPFAVSDAISTIAGYYLGRYKIVGEKTAEGSIAFFLSSMFLFAVISSDFQFIVAFAAIAAIIELIPVNDNISLPLLLPFALKGLNLVL